MEALNSLVFELIDSTGSSAPWYPMASNAYLLLAFAALGLLSLAAHVTPYWDFDLAITRRVQSIRARWFDYSMRALGFPGFPPQVAIEMGLGIVILFLFISRPAALAVAFGGVAIGALGFIVKYLVARPRPSPKLVHVMNPKLDGGKYSYMAGHVGSYVAILGFLAFLVFTMEGDPWWRVPVLIVLGCVIALIGLARVYSGEHWFSDVVGGYLLGSICLVFTIRFYEWAVRFLA